MARGARRLGGEDVQLPCHGRFWPQAHLAEYSLCASLPVSELRHRAVVDDRVAECTRKAVATVSRSPRAAL